MSEQEKFAEWARASNNDSLIGLYEPFELWTGARAPLLAENAELRAHVIELSKGDPEAAELVISRIVQRLDEVTPDGVYPEKVEMGVASVCAELAELREWLTSFVTHAKAFLGPDWGTPTEPRHQQSFLVHAIHHLAGARDSFIAAHEALRAENERVTHGWLVISEQYDDVVKERNDAWAEVELLTDTGLTVEAEANLETRKLLATMADVTRLDGEKIADLERTIAERDARMDLRTRDNQRLRAERANQDEQLAARDETLRMVREYGELWRGQTVSANHLLAIIAEGGKGSGAHGILADAQNTKATTAESRSDEAWTSSEAASQPHVGANGQCSEQATQQPVGVCCAQHERKCLGSLAPCCGQCPQAQKQEQPEPVKASGRQVDRSGGSLAEDSNTPAPTQPATCIVNVRREWSPAEYQQRDDRQYSEGPCGKAMPCIVHPSAPAPPVRESVCLNCGHFKSSAPPICQGINNASAAHVWSGARVVRAIAPPTKPASEGKCVACGLPEDDHCSCLVSTRILLQIAACPKKMHGHTYQPAEPAPVTAATVVADKADVLRELGLTTGPPVAQAEPQHVCLPSCEHHFDEPEPPATEGSAKLRPVVCGEPHPITRAVRCAKRADHSVRAPHSGSGYIWMTPEIDEPTRCGTFSDESSASSGPFDYPHRLPPSPTDRALSELDAAIWELETVAEVVIDESGNFRARLRCVANVRAVFDRMVGGK